MALFNGGGGAGVSDASLANHRVVQQNATTGKLEVNGSPVDPYEFTWAQFILLVPSDYAGIYVVITDRFVDSRGVNRVRFVGGTEWSIDSEHMYFATLADAPSAVLWPGLRILVGSGVGVAGVKMTSNGTDYRLDAPYSVLANNLTPLSRAKGASPDINIEWLPASILIPRDANGRSLMRPGDYITLYNTFPAKVGSTDQLNVKLHIGSGNSASDTTLIAVADPTTTNYERWMRDVQIVRKADAAASVVAFRGLASVSFQSGSLATARTADVTLATLMDSVASYFNIGIYNSGLTDTALWLYEYEVRYHRGY